MGLVEEGLNKSKCLLRQFQPITGCVKNKDLGLGLGFGVDYSSSTNGFSTFDVTHGATFDA